MLSISINNPTIELPCRIKIVVVTENRVTNKIKSDQYTQMPSE